MNQNKSSIALAVFLALGLTGCASTPTSEINQAEAQAQRLSAISSIEERREIIKEQLDDEELAWFATALTNQAKESWSNAQEQYVVVVQAPERLNERLRMFNSTTRGEALDQHLTEAVEALNNANVIRAEAKIVLSDAFANNNILNELEAQKTFPRRLPV